MAEHELTIGETRFRVRSLPPVEAFCGLQLLTRVIGGAISTQGGASLEASLVSALTSAVEDLGSFYRLLQPFTRVQMQVFGQGPASWLDLSAGEAVFDGKPSLLLAFTVQAVVAQYSDFLTGSGQQLLQEMVSHLISLAKSAGLFGDSPQTPGSKTVT